MKDDRQKEKEGWRVCIVALIIAFCISPFASNAQCGVKVKAGDKAAYNEALAQYNSHKYRQSATLLRKVAGKNPKAADPQFWLGMNAVADGFNATAIRRYFTKCIELCPNYPNPLAHFYMGMIHYTDSRFDDAVAELNQYFDGANGNDDKLVSAAYEEASNYLYWSQFLADAMLNMAPFDPQQVEGVSSGLNEALPYLTVDGQTFYYLREMPVSREKTFYHRELEERRWQICMSRRKDSTWSKGVELPPPFNSGDPEGSVSITADGRELYYSIIRRKNGYNNSDIYRAEWKAEAGKWTVAPLGPQVNGEKTWESQPSVSADGQTLYFASNRGGGQGGTDIWRCRRLGNGDWGRAENLGTNINTSGNERFPFVAADGHTLYFLSDGWQGFGGYDVYFCNLNDTYGNRPTNLGLPINTEGDEISFGVTADGRQGYFAGRTETSRSSDILMFDLYPAARPEPMTMRRMKVTGNNGVRDTVLVLAEKNLSTVTVAEGGMLPAIYCRTAYKMPTTVTLNDTLAPLAVTFLSGSRLTPEGELVTDALAAWLIENPRVHLAIECPKYTDAKTVYDRLKKKGLRAERFDVRGGSEYSQPQIRRITDQQ
ncbi:MAG: PD40 domain-containing protein [Bacteroidales bacterium]|nr:PD40 domain-containing protein [Bacteroidales bacterium]